MEQQVPEWWKAYKEANPNDTDEYNPIHHCCKAFWKDFCYCYVPYKRKTKKKPKKKN
tara:strand:- start:274 stop:444 length:171 start_codon:yes stop_codon:yes gene_type:complete